MEFGNKLKALRKNSNLTQEQLADKLYVSRTAISKWESGRGYPSIDSMRTIAAFFSVSLDELLSPDEVLLVAENENRTKAENILTLILGLLDICAVMLLFLPFFANRVAGTVTPTSLIGLSAVGIYLKIVFLTIVAACGIFGIILLALQNIRKESFRKTKVLLSLVLGTVMVLAFSLSLQPYAAVFAFSLLAVKVITLIKLK